MPAKVAQIFEAIDELCPFSLAEPWDNVGLQLGSGSAEAESILLTLDTDAAVVDEAARGGHAVILTHHPLIFEPLKSVSDSSRTGAVLQQAARAGLAVIAAHTNLDAARSGLADQLADLLGIVEARPVEGAALGWSKLVTFVPAEDLEAVRSALFQSGAGVIGDYSHCSYYLSGTGTFLPLEGADPSVGERGREEKVEELRLEMVFPSDRARDVVTALCRAHSYEEPAYDIYPLESISHDAGSGRAGALEAGRNLEDFAAAAAGGFGMKDVCYSGNGSEAVRRAAVVPGSGASLIRASAEVADVLVTGDIKYHDRLLADELGLALVEIPHGVSERTALERWAPRLEAALAPLGVAVSMSQMGSAVAWSRSGAVSEEGGSHAGTAEADSVSGSRQANGKEQGMHQLHVDGGSRGNPGPAGIGVVLTDAGGGVIDTVSEYIGEATNNVAEYSAMVAGLSLALERGIRRLHINSDSELVVRQLEGRYKVKNEGLRSYYEQAMSLLGKLESYRLTSVPREANAHADELVNRALDESGH